VREIVDADDAHLLAAADAMTSPIDHVGVAVTNAAGSGGSPSGSRRRYWNIGRDGIEVIAPVGGSTTALGRLRA